MSTASAHLHPKNFVVYSRGGKEVCQLDLGFILPKLLMIFAPMVVGFIAVKCKKWDADGNKVLAICKKEK